MNTQLGMILMGNNNYDCHHEELIRSHDLEINELKTELGYKKERLDAMDKKIDKRVIFYSFIYLIIMVKLV